MGPAVRWCGTLAILGAAASAQIRNLSTTFSGDDLYFVTDLIQRGTSQLSTNKVFLRREKSLTLIEQSPQYGGAPLSTYYYLRTALSATGSVWAVNRLAHCGGGSSCFFRELAWTDIQTPSGTLHFDGHACLSANGRFAVLYGNTNQAPGSAIPEKSVRLADLQSGQVVLLGRQAAQDGQMVGENGTVLVARENGIRLIGPKSTDLVAFRPMNRALLSPDASRIVYDVPVSPFEIRVIDATAGVDRPFGPGNLPALAADGRRFSYLSSDDGSGQVWLGDAVTGSSRPLSNEPEGIYDQTITGDGATVFAATRTARLLSINTVTGAVTQLLDSPGPRASLLAPVVPGSYNEFGAYFPPGVVPEILVGTTPAVILGRSPRGTAIQIPWEVRPDPTTKVVLSSPEPAWENVLRVGVSEAAGMVFALGARPGFPYYYYALHEDWSGLVTPENPARPGEIIHMYGTGYGPVDGTIATGEPTPTDRLYRMTTRCVWQAIDGSNGPRRFEVFAGLAPGLVGMYQFDFHIPPDWSYRFFNAYCAAWPSTSSFLPTAAIDVQPKPTPFRDRSRAR